MKHLVLRLIEENDIRSPIQTAHVDAKNKIVEKGTNEWLKITYANRIPQDSIYWIFLMGIEHENIHLETSCSIISHVPLEYIKKQYDWNYPLYPFDTEEEKNMNMAVAKTIQKTLTEETNSNEELKKSLERTHIKVDNPAPPSLPHLLLHNRLMPVVGGTVKLGKNHIKEDIY